MELDIGGQGSATLSAPRAALRHVRLLEFGLARAGDGSRAEVEAYIHGRFNSAHEAHVTHFLPNLISVGMGGRHCAAVGLAMADRGPLFSEIYLNAPVEQVIAERIGKPVKRSEILEIGNLVSTWKGSSLLLFVFLSELVAKLGHPHVVFTATPEVQRSIARLGYKPEVLASAEPEVLPDRGAQWGNYYQRGPKVMLGDAQPAIAAARRDLLYRGVAHTISGSVDRVLKTLTEG